MIKVTKEEIIKMESDILYELMRKYALEQSTVKDFITNYQEIILKYIAQRFAEEGYWVADLSDKLSIDSEWGLDSQSEALRKWFGEAQNKEG